MRGRWLVALGLGIAVAGQASAAPGQASTAPATVRPGPPPVEPVQLDPIHLRREDAQRLASQQPAFDDDTTRAARPREPLPPPTVTDPNETARSLRRGGTVLLGVAGVTALASVPFLILDTPLSGTNQDTYDTWAKGLLITAAASGLVGTVLIVSNRAMQVAPMVSSRSVGLSITGRL